MTPNILVTGAAGYLGGSIMAGLLSRESGAFKPDGITAVVRTDDQAQKLSKLGVHVLQVDLTDGKAVTEAVLKQNFDIVLHCASAIEPALALPLIDALGEQVKRAGTHAYFIHTSGTSSYADTSGWTHGEVKDTDPVFDLERKTEQPYYARTTNISVHEHADKHGVTPCIVVPPAVYGEGSGEYNRQSFLLPGMVRTGKEAGKLHKYSQPGTWPAVHITDMVDLYVRLVERIAAGDASLPNSVAGYWFGTAHYIDVWETQEALAAAMHARGLLSEPTVDFYPSDEAASEAWGMPVSALPLALGSKTTAVAERSAGLGWKPSWDKSRFLSSMGEEIDSVLKLGAPKSSLGAKLKNLGENEA